MTTTGLHALAEALAPFAELIDPPEVAPDPEELIYVFVGGTHNDARLEARRRGLNRTWQWHHLALEAHLAALEGYDTTDLVIIDLGPVDPSVDALLGHYRPPSAPTLDDAVPGRPIDDIDTGGRL